jgi:hypothetical protein
LTTGVFLPISLRSLFMERAILDQCFGLSTNVHRRLLYRPMLPL